MNTLRNAAVFALLSLASIGTSAHAGDYGCPPRSCGHYETVYVTRIVQVPCNDTVTLYDHCGHPYQVERTTYRAVPVKVTKQVWVTG
jgi:hypothetical protein